MTAVEEHDIGSTPGWRAAYLVLTHTDACATERLVAAIRRSSPNAVVLVAHDARAEPAPTFADEQVQVWCHGLATDWGSWELVEATLGAVERARAAADPDFFVLVSGQDYPVRHLATWEAEVRAAGGGWVGRPHALAYEPAWGRAPSRGDDDLTRYTYRWWPIPAALARVGRAAPAGVRRAAARTRDAALYRVAPVLAVRFVSRGRGAYVGVRRLGNSDTDRVFVKCDQWVAFDRDLAGVVLRELAPGMPLRRLYERSIIPDESAIQTVLASVEPPRVHTPVSFVRWVPSLDQPAILTLADLPEIRASRAPFCRKVRAGRSTDLLAALDGLLARPGGAPDGVASARGDR
jgi:hypothetical protein